MRKIYQRFILQFAPPAAPIDIRLGQRLDADGWVDASQGSQRLPVKAVRAPPLKAAVGPAQAYLKSIEYLKGVVEHPSQYYHDDEPEAATLQQTVVPSQASLATASQMDFIMDLANDYVNSQTEAVAAEVMQEGVASDGSQQTESDASSDNDLPEGADESEAVEQRPGKLHSCPYCAHSTSKKPDLVRHIRTHTKSKPFRCVEYGYSANTRSHITVHLRTHSEVKPYACERCGYRSRNISDLIVHRRKHTGEKPYACPYGNCLYRSTHHGNLGRHIRRNH